MLIGENSVAQAQYNRFTNLDSIEERIINYLIKSDSIYANRIWKILRYSTTDALLKKNLTQSEKAILVDDDGEFQTKKRVFRYPFLEDAFTEQCSLMRIYIDSIVPKNHLTSIVNIGIDLITHNKINNLYNDANDEIEYPESYNPTENEIVIKSRKTTFLKNILAELNGADIEGVGQLQFNRDLSSFSQAKLGLFNNRDYTGYKVIFACIQSGVN
jgi:hypothetical protein